MNRLVLVFLLFSALVPSIAGAQCVVGLAGEPSGQISDYYNPIAGEIYNVYVLLHWDGIADAVSYRLEHSGLNDVYFLMNTVYGPDGGGLNIQTVNGENVGLGVCAVGYTQPIVVARYDILMFQARRVTITAVGNPDSDPDFPVISNCVGDLIACDIGRSFIVDFVSTESESFGAVKQLYAN